MKSVLSMWVSLVLLAVPAGTVAKDREFSPKQSIVLSSTTSADNSGLYEVLLPAFTRESGIEVQVVAVGTGRALSIARRGDADVLIVHDEQSELEFVRQGYGIDRATFMYNDYILVGPVGGDRRVSQAETISEALRAIYRIGTVFVSRSDDSGTHKKELSLWRMALGEVPVTHSWYREIGAGMGATLNLVNEMGAYTLSDRATWGSFNNRDRLEIVIENEPPLNNPYSVILVNPEIHPHVRFAQAKIFADWLVSEKGLSLIRDFRVLGQQLFFTY